MKTMGGVFSGGIATLLPPPRKIYKELQRYWNTEHLKKPDFSRLTRFNKSVRDTEKQKFPQTVHVETVILLSRKTLDAVININLDMSELDLTSAESKATYAEIKKYVLDKFGLKVSQLYIAQVKREFGLIERINYNVGEGKNHVPQVTPEKREAIIDALKHFQMIE